MWTRPGEFSDFGGMSPRAPKKIGPLEVQFFILYFLLLGKMGHLKKWVKSVDFSVFRGVEPEPKKVCPPLGEILATPLRPPPPGPPRNR